MSIRRHKPTELLQGTLDLLILKALVHGELHGLAIAHRVEQMTNGTFEVKPGSLFHHGENRKTGEKQSFIG
jgi:DNA-binding PadR family transcriptional regulator